MPDVPRQRILTLLLVTLLGNSGLACACALASLDAPAHAHHSMSDEHAIGEPAPAADCEPACGGHGSTALTGKISTLPDFQAEKSFAPALHYEHAIPVLVASRTLARLHANQRSLPPPSTPVSRRDTKRD